MATFGQIGADLSQYQRPRAVSPLESLISGFNQGEQFVTAPQRAADQELLRQLQMASVREKLLDLQDPNRAIARQVAQELAVKGALNPQLGISAAPTGLAGETIAQPGTAEVGVGGEIIQLTPRRADIAPINIGTTPTGLVINPEIPAAAEAEKRRLAAEAAANEPFTLAPGAVRFVGGKQIAAAPEKGAEAKTFTLSPGQTVFNSSGQAIASLPANEKGERNVVVAPGSVVIDSQGKEVFRNSVSTSSDAATAYGQERAGRILSDIASLKNRVSPYTTGFGSLLSAIPTTESRDFKADVDSLKSSIAFGELADMRAASKTGGALGAVSNKELNLLEGAMGSLDAGQSPANFSKNLQKIEDSIKRWQSAKAKLGGGASSTPSGKIQIRAPDGTPGYWDASKPIPAGYSQIQ